MLSLADHLVIPLVTAISLVEWLWYWPRMRARADEPGTRLRAYRNVIAVEWGISALVLGTWAIRGRSWAALGLGTGRPLGLAIGFALLVFYLVTVVRLRRAILASPERLERLARRTTGAEPLLPRTSAERRLFLLTALTAGVCEELLFRGFVPWYLAPWTGATLAVVLASLAFGLGHVYLGPSLIVLAAGSLWPAIALHAAMDIVSGDLGSRALAHAERRETVHA
jgi:membrane protease YdiL (CAAX protease family)